ncbi:hypothetical protein [Singulisphaera acidiphila]|uniref:Uncharacterized protein n=1 Tax=Singulisphaera acidiphila (strain ATCC BAA-1392 / DSM 18658 / VKM B-2454 / MOB10) TaxID=886293 RepID=L0DKI7_SINAD|nr:hypothetical protein [Singulisphaera acidiphila]AGA29777.1 hypothetical protein Sinac_5646 [Singulisphaera acidiphila DSM 18658]
MGDDSTYCGVCDGLSPRREAQVRAARIGLQARCRSETAEQEARTELRKKSSLTEMERRRLWNGYRGRI